MRRVYPWVGVFVFEDGSMSRTGVMPSQLMTAASSSRAVFQSNIVGMPPLRFAVLVEGELRAAMIHEFGGLASV